jgi:hypothetical protein
MRRLILSKAAGYAWISQVLRADLMKIPKRPVVDADIHHVSDHVFCWRDAFERGVRVGRFSGKSLLEQCRNPRRAVAKCFDLLILNEDGVAANPVVATNGNVEQL